MWFRLAKVSSILFVAGLAIIGLKYDFRLPDGSLTIWGKAAIYLTITSALIAVSLEFWEQHKSSKDEAVKEAKEAAKEKTLKDISANIQSIEDPLLPASIIITLRVPRKDNDRFGDLPSIHQTDDFSKLLRLNPTADEPYRMQIPDGFIDIDNGTVISAGVYRTEPPILNTIEEKATHTYIRLNPEKLSKAVEANLIGSDLCRPGSVHLKIKAARLSEPIELQANVRTAEPIRLVVFDEYFYITYLLTDIVADKNLENSVSMADLMNSNLSLKLMYMTLGIASTFRPSDLLQVQLIDFQIVSGSDKRRYFTFPEHLLQQQGWQNADLNIGGDATALELCLECEISANDYRNATVMTSK